jgi:P-type E1-E2 ATPase
MIVYTFWAGAKLGSTTEILKRLAQAFNYVVVLAIASFPEGLPLTIVLALAFSVGEMYKKDNILVRDTAATETMGKVQEVLVGKSGTITKG